MITLLYKILRHVSLAIYRKLWNISHLVFAISQAELRNGRADYFPLKL